MSDTCILAYMLKKNVNNLGTFKSHIDLIWLSHPSSSIVLLSVDEPALALIMTQNHAKVLLAL